MGSDPLPTEVDAVPTSGELLTALRGLVDWAIDRVHRHLRRHGARLTAAGGELGDLFVSVTEIRQALSGGGPTDLVERLGLDPPGEPAPSPRYAAGPLRLIAERLGLDPLEVDLVAAAAAPHLSLDVARLYRFAIADFTARLPTAAFLCELITDDPDAAMQAHGALRGDGRLVAGGLVRLDGEGWPAGAPGTHRGVFVAPAVLAFLRGEASLTPAPRGAARPERISADIPAQAARARVDVLLGEARPRAVLIGAAGSGRQQLVLEACARRGRAVAVVDLEALPRAPADFTDALLEVVLDARLRGEALLLRGDGFFARPDEPRLPALARTLYGLDGPLFLVARQRVGELQRLGVALDEVEVPLPDEGAQRRQWQASLAARGVERPALVDELASAFSLTPGAIERAVRLGRRAADLAGEPLEVRHVADAARRQIRHALDTIAEPVSTTLGWDDVVLPPRVIETLREIVSQARHRARVFDTWGFRRTMAYGRGLACLFAGPPGTGKTMLAGIIAAEVGRALYRVDLSRVVSKWVGETEKNLARIFDEAEQAQVILFFDEADSLFSARTEVKGANDRFANMEVNYLLQRMESFDGMTILTTNFERGLDPAFRRRLRFQVHFPLPDAEQRAEMWQRMIPAQMPIDGEIDFSRLGKRFKLSGGNIKNAVLRAAFYAAERGSGLDQRLLVRAAEAESRELGRL